MSNVLISNLPTWTGTAADLRWYIMNNSGNTETFKYSGYTSPFKYSSEADQNILSLNYPDSSIVGYRSILLGGVGSYITATGTGASGHTVMNSATSYVNWNSGAWPGVTGIYSAQNSYISGSAWGATIMGGYDNYVSNSPFAIVLGGQNNRVYGSGLDSFHGARGAVVGGYNNYISESSAFENSGIFGSMNSYIQDSANSTIVGAGSSSIQGGSKNFIQSSNSNITNSGNYMAIIGGHNHGIVGGNESGIFAGYSHTMTGGQDSAMLGGRGNVLDMGNACCGGNVMMGGESNQMIDSPNVHSAIMGGYANIIRSNSPKSAIIGGESSTISGLTAAVMVGTSGRTADASYTTYVENLRVYKQIYNGTFNVGSVGAGTTTLNFDNGNIQYFQLNAGVAATLDASNYKEGATYIVKVKQPSSGAASTLSYTSPLFKFPNGVAPTLSVNNNEEDILSFVCIGGSLYGNIQKSFI